MKADSKRKREYNLKSRFDYEKGECEYEKSGWCELPSRKRCKDKSRVRNGGFCCMRAL
jgi:hypothetical protein